MKLTIERAALLRALAHVQSVVERRNTIPILSNLLMRGEKGEIALAATDMDIEIIETVPAEIQRAGTTTVPAHTLYDIVRKLRDGSQIQFETDGVKGTLTLRSGRSTFTLATLPAEDFPPCPAASCRTASRSRPTRCAASSTGRASRSRRRRRATT